MYCSAVKLVIASTNNIPALDSRVEVHSFSSFEELNDLPLFDRASALTIGNFDGFHLGHQYLIDHVLRYSQSKKLHSIALSFAPHPARYFRPDKAPELIDTQLRKIDHFLNSGIDSLVILPFAEELAEMSADDFISKLLINTFQAKHIFVGEGFHFGKNRQGNVERINHLGKTQGLIAESVPVFTLEEGTVSSSTVRQAIRDGDIAYAQRLLGRPPCVTGIVERGYAKGRELGFRTANIDIENELLPPAGVYAALVRLPDRQSPYQSIVNIGHAPTFHRNREIKLEAHLFDFSGDLVGKRLKVELIAHIRYEKPFRSSDELVLQINKDIVQVKKILLSFQR